MSESTNKALFDSINPSPKNAEEKRVHEEISQAWAKAGRGAIYGIQLLTASEEAKLRNPDFNGDPSTIDPRWVGSGPVTAVVTVSAAGIERGQGYRELANQLGIVTPGVAVELVPWTMEAPAGHTLAQ